jgi:hypothetical protein
MLPYLLNQDVTVPVLMSRQDSSPAYGIPNSQASVTITKADGSEATFTPSGAQWAEKASGNNLRQGIYLLTIPAAYCDVAPFLAFAVAAPLASALIYTGVVELCEANTDTIYSRIGAPTGASIAADVADVRANLGAGAPTAEEIRVEVEGSTVLARESSVQAAQASADALLPLLQELLRMSGQNYVLDSFAYSEGLITSCRVRTYASKAAAVAEAGPVSEYTMAFTRDGASLLKVKSLAEVAP